MELCNSVPIKICSLGLAGTPIHQEAILISQKFKKLFHLYGICHREINKNTLINQEEKQQLGKV